MTTQHPADGENLEQLNVNLTRIEALSTRLVAALSGREEPRSSLQAPSSDLFWKAANAWGTQMLADPTQMMQQQISFWSDTLRHAAEGLAQEDRRFSDPLWQANPYCHFVKAQFLAANDAMENSLAQLQGVDTEDHARISFFSRQIMELFAPSNFLATNPQAMARAVETDGQSLVDGLENMVNDLEAHDGQLVVSLCDRDAFEVGENIATSEGTVVFRNRMFELIQYAPRTEKVHRTPLVLFPPWINKFYILDLKEKNSLVRWITEQGFTLFVVSWVNPDADYADVGIDTYVEEGFLTAIETVKQICGVKKVNVTGYCIGGTTLALTLALMQKRGDTSVNSATFFTTLTDFADPGEVGVFLHEDFVGGIADEIAEKGYLDSLHMARTFSYLRAADLVYAPAVKSYLLGQAPPAFDLLYWNGDGTNLPGRMANEYLHGLCQGNEFSKTGFAFLDETVTLADVDVPICAIACETDHIAPWASSYAGIHQMGSKDKTFILSESGHIAGIVNPPTKLKYGHYTLAQWPDAPQDWLKNADFTEGSWWGRWGNWLAKRSGAKIKARVPLDRGLGKAPGKYVTAQPKK